jgi:prevent-host-death family protein
MSTVPVRDLRNHSADVLARVIQGESLTVTRDGEPVATISPLPRRQVGVAQLIEHRRTLPVVDAAALRTDLDELLDSAL